MEILRDLSNRGLGSAGPIKNPGGSIMLIRSPCLPAKPLQMAPYLTVLT